jgi:hypothetical protein
MTAWNFRFRERGQRRALTNIPYPDENGAGFSRVRVIYSLANQEPCSVLLKPDIAISHRI